MLELLNQMDGFDARGDVKVRAWFQWRAARTRFDDACFTGYYGHKPH